MCSVNTTLTWDKPLLGKHAKKTQRNLNARALGNSFKNHMETMIIKDIS